MDQSFGTRPFRFDREFAPAPARGAPGYGENSLEVAALRAEMEALRADHAVELARARSEGFIEAIAQAREEREQALLAAMDALHAEWEMFEAAREDMIGQLRHEAGALARSIGEALAARALSIDPAGAIDDAIGRVLTQIARGQEVVVGVSPDLVADVEARIAHRQSLDRRRLNLVVLADENIAAGDAHLLWEGGGMRLDAADRAANIAAEMEALGIGER